VLTILLLKLAGDGQGKKCRLLAIPAAGFIDTLSLLFMLTDLSFNISDINGGILQLFYQAVWNYW
jgi:hypothetical protein